MNAKKIVISAILLGTVLIFGFFFYKKHFAKTKSLPYRTQKPERRTIKRIIDTTGKLQISDKNEIGALVAGTIEKLHVEENDVVKKGQLLAEIDTGKGDADVRSSKGSLEQAQANYDYQKKYFARQKAIYKAGQLAQDAFDVVVRDYHQSKGALLSAKAQYDRSAQEYKNTKIFAPESGVVIRVGVSEGQTITTQLDATILFSIAKDITKMEAELEVDESDIGYVKPGQSVEFTIDTFPNKIFRTKIKQISYSPKSKSGEHYYKATVLVDNSEKNLRPGLSIDAKIFVAKAKDALAIPSQAFMISSKVLEEIAKDLDLSYHPVDKQAYKEKKKDPDKAFDTVWVTQANGEVHSFVEKIVTTNLTDDLYFEITSGLNEEDDVIVEIEESNYMEELYKKAFKGRF